VPIDRRVLLGAAISLAVAEIARAGDDPVLAQIGALEEPWGGRLGVAAIDLKDRRTIAYRADERFPMCSTFKLLLVADVLSRIERRTENPDHRLSYGPSDLVGRSPVTRAHVGEGSMRVEDLCAAAVEVSDNTAANLLLSTVGGPAGVTAYARSVGDVTTRLDRNEPTLNEGTPGDPRDTTMPAAMIADMENILLNGALTRASCTKMFQWLVASTTGVNRIRKGVPREWQCGDKAGTGNTATNDLAILWPPGRKPILIAAYYAESKAAFADQEAVLASVGAIVAKTFA
jgi:beta-lactamase class A